MNESSDDPRERLERLEEVAARGGHDERLDELVHELRNPLASIAALSEWLVENPSYPDLQSVIHRIIRSADHCKRLLDHVTENRDLDRRRVIDMAEVVADAIDMVPRPDLGVDIVGPSDPAPTAVLGNATRLRQLLVNLLANAVQALKGPGKIAVELMHEGDDIVVRVRDNGPGIPEGIHDQLFERGVTLDADRGGRGLGLAVAQDVATEHDGRLELESTGPSGTVFVLRIPRLEASRPRSERPVVRAKDGRRRVLVVDDDEGTIATYRLVVAGEGVAIVGTASARSALARLSLDADFDAVLIDFRLPDMTGDQLFEEMTRNYPHLASRIVFATGDLSRPETRRFLDESGRPYLVKPFRLDELRTALGVAFATT